MKNAHEPSPEEIQALVDGELTPEAAAEVRAALPRSPGALAELDECMQMAALAYALREDAAARGRWAELRHETSSDKMGHVIPFAPSPWLRQMVIAVPASLVVAAAAFVLWGDTGGGRDPVVMAGAAFADALAPSRGIEARLSWQPADRYRPYDTVRAAGEHPAETFSFELLARVEKLRDSRAMTAAEVLRADTTQAAQLAARTHSPDASSDRAAIALIQDKPDDAVLAAAAALAANPRHVQATWNRALALARLGLPLTAAEAFEAVASRKEPGWSQEASERATALRAGFERRKAAWKAANEVGASLVAGGMADEATVSAYPGLMRLYFYDAVRAAASAARVRALRPLAETLDARFHGHHLAAYVDRSARADFRRRGPLAARYAVLARGGLTDASAVRVLLGDLRAARQDDMLLGALLHTGPTAWRPKREKLDEYVALARALPDPWFEVEAAVNRAWTAEWMKDYVSAETVLSAIAPRCDGPTAIDYLCMDVFRLATHAYVALHRRDAARHALGRAQELARTSGNVTRESEILYYSYQVSSMNDDTSADLIDLSNAYLDEWTRQSDDCADARQAHEWKAITFINRKRLADARREIARDTSACNVPFTTDRAFVLTRLFRRGGSEGAVRALRHDIAGLRARLQDNPGERAYLDYLEGLLVLDGTPIEGRALLRRAIATGADMPDDVPAIAARSYSYSVLVEDAATRGASGEALALLAEQRGLETPRRCALGALSTTTTLFVARGANGAAVQSQLARDPGTPAGAHPVPDGILAALADCESVDVLAGPPYYGRPELLPREMAWAYRKGGPPRVSPPGPGRQVVVANIAPPPGLGLAALRPIADAPGVTFIEGSAATPARVMAAAASASILEIHAHGLLAEQGPDDAGEEDTSLLVLARDAQGSYALGGNEIRRARLRGAPVVVLAACHASAIGGGFHTSWGLADAFIEAGASGVIASPDPIQDAGASAFFSALRARLAAGQSPEAALREERLTRSDPSERIWIDRLVVFR